MKCYLEVPGSCDKNCYHCNETKLTGCYACNHSNTTEFNEETYFSIIDSMLCYYKCTNFILHGGNPFLNWRYFEIIIGYIRAKSKDCMILVLVNESIPSREIEDYINNKNAKTIYNINWRGCDHTIEEILHIGIDQLFNININLDSIEEFKQSLLNFKSRNIKYKCSYISSNNHMALDYPSDLPQQDPRLLAYPTINGKSCLFGQIAVSSDMKIYPCNMLKYEIASLDQLLSKSLDINAIINYWEVDISTCQNCKFRSSCIDCRAYELVNGADIKGKVSCKVLH